MIRQKRLFTFGFIIMALPIFYSCGQSKVKAEASIKDSLPPVPSPVEKLGIYEVDGDSLVIPSFSVRIELSPAAQKRIAGTGETIVLDAYYTGEPKDTVGVEYSEDGQFNLASSSHEVKAGETVVFDNVKFPRRKFAQLQDKDIEVLVNVYTGRHTTGDNLLNCDILSEKVSKLAGKEFILKAKLIYGDE